MKKRCVFKITQHLVAIILVSGLCASLAAAQTGPSLDRQLLGAVERSDVELAETLPDKGADVNAKDEKGETALMKAAAHGCDP
jgi:hypothetical protein